MLYLKKVPHCFWRQFCALNIKGKVFSMFDFGVIQKFLPSIGQKIDKDLTEEEVDTSLLVKKM